MFFLLVVFAAGCKKVIEEPGLIGVCPKVISTNPLDSAIGVSINPTINATFNEAIDSSTINATSFTLQQGTTPIAGTITYTGMTATFSLTKNLLPNTKYTGTIYTGVKDHSGNAMLSNYVWNFTTGSGPDITAPVVTSTDPANGTTGVSLNKKISATFSKAMDSLSTTTSFTLANTTLGGTPVNGSVSYSGITAVFSPSGNLLSNTTYTGTIATVAKDISGNTMVSNYVWSFTTGTTSDVTARPAGGEKRSGR